MPILVLFLVMMFALKIGVTTIITSGGHIAAVTIIAGALYLAHRYS